LADKKVRIVLDGDWRHLLDNREIIDEDDMASDSEVHVPTQQSVKAYVDTEVAGAGGGFEFDGGGADPGAPDNLKLSFDLSHVFDCGGA
jgi:hypothetical protein